MTAQLMGDKKMGNDLGRAMRKSQGLYKLATLHFPTTMFESGYIYIYFTSRHLVYLVIVILLPHTYKTQHYE